MRDERDGDLGHGVRRLCVAVGREHGAHGLAEETAESAMARILVGADTDGALQRAQWLGRPNAWIALLPPGIDEARVITSLLRYLRDEVYRHNQVSDASARLRLRVAVHEGLTHVQDEIFVGDVIDTVGDLVSEPSFIAHAGTAEVAVIVTDRIYADVIRGRGAHDLRAEDFTELRTRYGVSWAHVAALPDRDVPPRRGPEPTGAGESSEVSINVHGRFKAERIAGRSIVRSRNPERVAPEPGASSLHIEAGEVEAQEISGRDNIGEPKDD